MSNISNGDDVFSYSYNGDNLRKSKTINNNTTQYILDGMNVVAELNSQGNRTYLMGINLEGYLSGTNRRYYSTEPNGTVYSVYGDNTANYENIDNYIYGAYGNTLSAGQTDNPFKFAGEYTDSETELIYLRNRYYDPNTGRFISEDTHWNPKNMIYGDKEYKVGEIKIPDMSATMQSSNLYAYCMNNPMRFVDPSGESVSGAVFLAVVASCAVDGLITGGIYKWNGKPFGVGFINGFVSCLGTEAGAVIGVKTGHPYVGIVIGNTIGEAAGSMVEVLVRNEIYGDKITIDEAAESAAKAAASGILSGVGSSYVKYAIELADEAGSAAKTLIKYDKKFGKALDKFFSTLSTMLSAQ